MTLAGVERRAPVQHGPRRYGKGWRPPGTVAWSEHIEAWTEYAAKYGYSQDAEHIAEHIAERIADRGGFGYLEMTDLLGHEPKTWEPR